MQQDCVCRKTNVADVYDANVCTCVGVRLTDLHFAELVVVGKVLDVDVTTGLQHEGTVPHDVTEMVHLDLDVCFLHSYPKHYVIRLLHPVVLPVTSILLASSILRAEGIFFDVDVYLELSLAIPHVPRKFSQRKNC